MIPREVEKKRKGETHDLICREARELFITFDTSCVGVSFVFCRCDFNITPVFLSLLILIVNCDLVTNAVRALPLLSIFCTSFTTLTFSIVAFQPTFSYLKGLLESAISKTDINKPSKTIQK